MADVLLDAQRTRETGVETLGQLSSQGDQLRKDLSRNDSMARNLDIGDQYVAELTKPFFVSVFYSAYEEPAPPLDGDDIEYDISLKSGWMWRPHKMRITNLCMIRFKAGDGPHGGAVADKFGYQYISYIQVTKPGYYRVHFSLESYLSEGDRVPPWTLFSPPEEAKVQIKEICRRAKWFLDYDIEVLFDDEKFRFRYEPPPKPRGAGSGLPKFILNRKKTPDGAPEARSYDKQLDVLSGLLTDMKGIQMATQEELAEHDRLIESLVDKCDVNTARIRTTIDRMDYVERNY